MEPNEKVAVTRALVAVVGVLVLILVFSYRSCVLARPHKRPRPNWSEGTAVPKGLLTYRRVGSLPYRPSAVAWGVALDGEGNLAICGEDGLVVYGPDRCNPMHLPLDAMVRAVIANANGWLCCCGAIVIQVDRHGHEIGRWDHFGPGARLDAVAVGKGSIYLADGGQMKIWKVAPDGGVLGSWGDDPAAGDRRIKVPGPWFDLAWGHGLLAVSNPGRHRVQFYDDEGNLVNFYGGYDQNDLAKFVGCCNPVALAFVGDRRIVVSEKGICRIKILEWDGSVDAVVARPEDFVEESKRRAFAIDLAVDADGTIYALENHASMVEIWRPNERP